jgi:hypothetical protein
MLSMIAPRTIRPSGAPIDIVKDLGLDHMQRVYERRVQAVAAPADYNRERKAAWTKLSEAVAKAYKETDENRELIASGISTAERQQLAVNAAKMVFATQSAIMQADFPSGSQAIALEASSRDNFPGILPRKRAPAAAKPRAPRKPRAKK